jgi:hypothetical protein
MSRELVLRRVDRTELAQRVFQRSYVERELPVEILVIDLLLQRLARDEETPHGHDRHRRSESIPRALAEWMQGQRAHDERGFVVLGPESHREKLVPSLI